MKIACITPSLIPSTTANSIQAVKACHALARLGHTVRLFSPGSEPVQWDNLKESYELTSHFEIERIQSHPMLKRYDFVWNSMLAASGWGAELVYTWLPQCAWLAGTHNLPSVLEMHDRLTGRLGPWFFRQYLKTPASKQVLVITRALQRVLEAQLGRTFKPNVIRIAPNGVDLNNYQNLPEAQTARAQLGLPRGFTAVYTGHFYAGRGMDLLLDLAGQIPDISFVWVGGNQKDIFYWQEKVTAADARNITITGFVPKAKLPLYQAAGDVLLMPYETAIAGSSGGNSAEICSPMKMFDYLATGRVIITSELPVLHEVLNEVNAIFCPPADVSAWSAAIRRVQQNPDLASNMAAQAKKDAVNFTWQNRAHLALEGLVE